MCMVIVGDSEGVEMIYVERVCDMIPCNGGGDEGGGGGL